MYLPQSRTTVFATRDLHHTVEHEERPAEMAGREWVASRVFGYRMTAGVGRLQGSGVGVQEIDGFGRTRDGQAPGLIDEFLGEIESGDVSLAQRPKTKCHTPGAAPSLQHGR